MIKLFSNFPRQVAIHDRKTVNSVEEMMSLINKYNGLSRIWVSLYNYAGPVMNTNDIELTHGWFDFDSIKALDNVILFHDWCLQNHYRHIIFFSGKGFHFYILFKNHENLKNSKIALYNFHNKIASTLGFTIGEHENKFEDSKYDLDVTGIGDVARVVTFPHTYNIKRKRYCISVSEEDLRLGYEWIKQKALKPHVGEYYWYGRFLYDISQHDGQTSPQAELLQISSELQKKIDNEDFLKTLPVCVANMLTMRPKCGYGNRWKVIIYMRDFGLHQKQIEEILKKYFKLEEYKHCVFEEKMVERLFRRIGSQSDFSFPSCENLRNQGLCPSKNNCDKSKVLYR